MAMPLTDRNMAICAFCDSCISGGRCRYILRDISFKPSTSRNPHYYSKVWYPKNKDKLKAKRRTPLEKIKSLAHQAVKRALISGELIQPDKCEFCKRKVELVAHHPNYNEFFKVIWCCKACHRKLHHAVSLSL